MHQCPENSAQPLCPVRRGEKVLRAGSPRQPRTLGAHPCGTSRVPCGENQPAVCKPRVRGCGGSRAASRRRNADGKQAPARLAAQEGGRAVRKAPFPRDSVWEPLSGPTSKPPLGLRPRAANHLSGESRCREKATGVRARAQGGETRRGNRVPGLCSECPPTPCFGPAAPGPRADRLFARGASARGRDERV